MKEVRFTPSQADAIDATRRRLDACVVAGPGSGKTTVLVEYFGNLVAAGVDPLRILAITFTEKAAGNMRKKLAEAFRGDREIRARMERAWVSTVHGFCGRLLRARIRAAAAGVYLSGDGRALSRTPGGGARAHPRPLLAGVRGCRAFGL